MNRFFTILLLSGVILTGCRRGLDNDSNVDDMRLLVSPTIAGSSANGVQSSAQIIADAKAQLASIQSASSPAAGVAPRAQEGSFTKSAWVNNDRFGFFLALQRGDAPGLLQFKGNNYNGFNYDNLVYTYTGTQFTAVETYYYPYRRNLVDLYAIYPYDGEMGRDAAANANGSKLDKTSAGNYPWAVIANQTTYGRKTGAGNATASDEFNIKQSDLLFAKKTGVTPNNTGIAQPLNFKHVMTKLVLKLLVPAEFDGRVLDPTQPVQELLLLNTITESRVNFQMDSVFTYGDTKTAISMRPMGSEVDAGGSGTFYYFECVAVPQKVAGGDYLLQANIKFTSGDISSFKLKMDNNGMLLLQGREHNMIVVFDTKYGLRLDGSTIKDWGAGTGGGGLIGEDEVAPAANSFIVSTGESIVINTTLAGNDIAGIDAYTRLLKDPATGVKSARLLWQTKDGHADGGALIIGSVDDQNLAAVVVKTNPAATVGGNAVLAAYDGVNGTGKILWSWHIWVTTENPKDSKNLATYGDKFAATNTAGKAIMDRNLGALTAAQASGMISGGGMLYQWGRKDPFTGTATGTNTNTAVPVYDIAGVVVTAKAGNAIAGDGSFKFLSSSANNIDGAIGNPMTFYNAGNNDWTSPAAGNLWNNPTAGAKSIYDPCPDGYRVAGGNTWRDLGEGGLYGTWSGTTNTLGGLFGELGSAPFYFSEGRRDAATGVMSSVGGSVYLWSSEAGTGMVSNSGSSLPYTSHFPAAAFAVRCVQEADITEHITVTGGGGISAAGGNTTIKVYANGAWSASISGAGFTLSAASGSGNGVLTVSAPALADGGGARAAVITITGAHGSVTRTAYASQSEATVIVGGVEWATANLTGGAGAVQGATSGFAIAASPSDYGMFWKWGSVYMYDRGGGAIPVDHWGAATTAAAAQPTTQSKGYDYANVSGITPASAGPVGDPCKALGADFRTPTQTQWAALTAVKSKFGTYNGVSGYFFGISAASCSNTNIAEGCIFIPFAGSRGFDGSHNSTDSYPAGCYWASSVANVTLGFECHMDNNTITNNNSHSRGNGLSVRCVKHTGPPVVDIGGAKWTASNLTGTAGQSTSVAMAANPQDYGMFYKWGDTWTYQRPSSSSDGKWTSQTSGASTNPSSSGTGGTGYDYGSLSGGRASGDPCKLLGAYRTPTRAQWQALVASGKSAWTTYNGIAGYFFGPKAASCNSTTIQDGCIFLPAAGSRSYSGGALNDEGGIGYYWSSSVDNSTRGCYCGFSSGGVYSDTNYYRGSGFSVRCVQE